MTDRQPDAPLTPRVGVDCPTGENIDWKGEWFRLAAARNRDVGLLLALQSETLPMSVVNDPSDFSPKEDFDALEFASYTDAKKAEVLFNRLQRELAEARTELGIARGHAMMAESASRAMADKEEARLSSTAAPTLPACCYGGKLQRLCVEKCSHIQDKLWPLVEALQSAPQSATLTPPPGMLLVDEVLFQTITKQLTPDQHRAVCLAEGQRLFKDGKMGTLLGAATDDTTKEPE